MKWIYRNLGLGALEGEPSGGSGGGTPPQTPPAAPTQTPPAPDAPKTFTQEELDRVAAKARAEERKKAQGELEERLKREKLEETERLKLEKADKDKEVAELKAKLEAESRLRQLTGKVVDPEAALKLVGPEDIGEDGKVNLEKLLARYPFLKPGAAPQVPGTGGGNPPGAPTLSRQQQINQALARGDMQEYIRLSQEKD